MSNLMRKHPYSNTAFMIMNLPDLLGNIVPRKNFIRFRMKEFLNIFWLLCVCLQELFVLPYKNIDKTIILGIRQLYSKCINESFVFLFHSFYVFNYLVGGSDQHQLCTSDVAVRLHRLCGATFGIHTAIRHSFGASWLLLIIYSQI